MKKEYALNVNRFRKVPVIHESNFRLSETVAIFHYLGREKIISYPSDARELAKIDEFLEWNHNSLLVTTGLTFLEAYVKPFTGINLPPHGMAVNIGQPLNFVVLNQSLSDLENLWLSEHKFLVGDNATFADVIAACNIMQIVGLKIYEIDAKEFPKVSKWLENVRQFYNPEFDNAHKFVYKMGDKFGGKPPTSAVIAFKIYQFFRKFMK